MIHQNDRKDGFTEGVLRYVYLSDSWKCTKNVFFRFYSALYDDNSEVSNGILEVSISQELYCVILNWLTIQNEPKNPSFYKCLTKYIQQPLVVERYVYLSDSPKCPKNDFFVLIWSFMMKFQKFLYPENYISYQIGWPFKITERPIFLLVLNTIYTSRTKGNGQKWEFQVFFWIRISEFLSKFNSL